MRSIDSALMEARDRLANLGLFGAAAIGWILVTGAALRNHLVRDERSKSTMRENNRNGYGAFVLYSLLAITAFWFPTAIAIVTTVSWIFWLTLGIRMKRA